MDCLTRMSPVFRTLAQDGVKKDFGSFKGQKYNIIEKEENACHQH